MFSPPSGMIKSASFLDGSTNILCIGLTVFKYWSTIDSITQTLQDNINICQNAQEKASKMWDYDKDSSLKDAVVNLLSMEVDYLQKFSETSRYWNIDNLTDEDKASYDSIVSDLNQSQTLLNQQFTNLQDVQEAFAVKHGLKLE